MNELTIGLVSGEELKFLSVTDYTENDVWVSFSSGSYDYSIKLEHIVYIISKEY